MNSVWLSLLWKEWREHRWILALIVAGCILIGLCFVVMERDWESFVAGPVIVLGFGVPAIAMFVGAGIAARERSQRTLGFMQALPASMKKAAVAKLLVGCATVMVPSLAACTLIGLASTFQWGQNVFAFADPQLASREYLVTALAALLVGVAAVSLLIWTAAAGVNHVDELRAGAIGLLTIACIWAGILITVSMFQDANKGLVPPAMQHRLEFVFAGAPAGIAAGIERLNERRWQADPWGNSWPFALAFVSSHGALAAWYVVRFGRGAKPQAVSETLVTVQPALQWLNSPRRTRAGAIVWKQFRESAPLAFVGGLAVFLLSPAIAGMTSSIARTDYFETWQMTAISTWLMAGVFVAVVAGIGLFYDDLRPELHTFWRSRPIDVDAWFWIKLFTGLTITIGAFATGPLLTWAALSLTGHTALVDIPDEPDMAQMYGGGLLLHSATFVLAALAIVLVRQPVMAAMLTIGAWITIAIFVVRWAESGPQSSATALAVLGIAGAGGFAILAWQALRRDWSWGA